MYTLAGAGVRIFADENRKESPEMRLRFLKLMWLWEFFLAVSGKADHADNIPESIGASGVETALRKDIESHRIYKRKDPYLIVYIGHGSPRGWVDAPTYEELASLLKNELVSNQKAIIINDTCYGAHLGEKLNIAGLRSRVSLMCSWDAQGPSYGGIALDALRAWLFRKKPEAMFANTVVSDSDGDREVETVLRWGPSLDRYWFLRHGHA